MLKPEAQIGWAAGKAHKAPVQLEGGSEHAGGRNSSGSVLTDTLTYNAAAFFSIGRLLSFFFILFLLLLFFLLLVISPGGLSDGRIRTRS